MTDLLVRDGWIVDGSGRAPMRGDVAITNGKIEHVGPVNGHRADRVIEAAGRIVCPGFVDPHSHSDWSLLANPKAESTIRQGVTTEVVGNCGWTYAPVSEASAHFIEGRMRTFAYDGPIEWSSFADHLSWLSTRGHAPNLAWFVGHNTVRYAAGCFSPLATEQELRAMEDFVREAMHAGALGMSTGLEFNPGRMAPTEELVRLNSVVGEYDGYYTSHVRNRDAHLQDSIEEFLHIIREGKTRGEISHLNVRHRTGAPPGGWQRAVDTMQEAREVEGLDVLADTTPFKDGLGQMAGILPQWAMEGGWEKACARLMDSSLREKLKTDCDRYWRFIHRGEWHRARLQSSPQFPEFEGLDFNEIAQRMGTTQWDAYFDILAASGPALESILLIGELFTDEHLTEMIAHPLISLGVDGFTSAVDSPLAAVTAHPVCFAGHVHYLTRHVGELQSLALEEAIHKMTAMPAEHFGLRDRGRLEKGRAADVVVLDLEQLEDGSTLADPVNYVRGVDWVLVNGQPVVADGEHTGALPGRHLSRTG